MDIIMTTAQISMEVFDWGHNRQFPLFSLQLALTRLRFTTGLSVRLPIQDRIILCLEYTMSPSLDGVSAQSAYGLRWLI